MPWGCITNTSAQEGRHRWQHGEAEAGAGAGAAASSSRRGAPAEHSVVGGSPLRCCRAKPRQCLQAFLLLLTWSVRREVGGLVETGREVGGDRTPHGPTLERGRPGSGLGSGRPPGADVEHVAA